VDSSTTSVPGGKWTSRTWYDARYGISPTEIILTFLKPVGPGCDEQQRAVVEQSGVDVRAIVRVDEPWAPPGCALEPSQINLVLDAPLGQRKLLTFGSNKAFIDREGSLQLDVSSTPCGRADCSSPSPEPAACGSAPVAQAVARDIDGSDPGGDVVHCDGSFLVVDVTTGAGGCPPEQRQDCAHPQRAYFVARERSWRLVTYGRDMTCDNVFKATVIHFPDDACPGDREVGTS
jgi:hypothetical protein